MSECDRLDQQSGSLVDRHDDTPSLIFFVRVSIDPQLRKGRSPTITPAVNSDISAVKVFELVVGNSPHLKKKGKNRQLNYSEIIYTCYYAFLCMKIAVFFDHLDDLKESKNPWSRCFAQYKRHSVLCWTGDLIYIVD